MSSIIKKKKKKYSEITMIILTFKWISQNFLRIIRIILLQFHSINPWFFHFILLRSQEDYRIETFHSLISTKKTLLSLFLNLSFFYNCLLYFYLLHSQHSFQGKIVENGIFEKKRLVNSDRYVSHISINFGNIVRYTKGQYSLMKTKAARSESRNCSF